MALSYRLSRSNSNGSNCRAIVTAFSIAVCVRIWITSAIAMSQTDKSYGHWLRTYAVVVGAVDEYDYDNISDIDGNSAIIADSNNTNAPSDVATSSAGTSRISTYCALMNYTTARNEPVLSVSDYPSDCSTSPSGISIGLTYEVRYNPENPKEFIKQVLFEDEIMSLGLMIGIGIMLTAMLCYFVCKSRPEEHHHQSSFDSVYGDGEDEERGRLDESDQERKERILSKMIFQRVREDLSNITAEQLRAQAVEAAAETENIEVQQEDEEGRQEGQETNVTDQESIPDPAAKTANDGESQVDSEIEGDESRDGKDDNLSVTRHTATSIELGNNLGEDNQGNGLLQMFSSYWRPEGEDECSICLEKYEAGQLICASKNSECTHVYHAACVVNWLARGRDRCPLCRTDLMK